MKKRICILFTCLLYCLGVFAKPGKIKGIIKDAKNDEPLIAAAVMVQGTAVGSIADMDGYFVIENMPAGTYTLIISYLGYDNATIENIQVLEDQVTQLTAYLYPAKYKRKRDRKSEVRSPQPEETASAKKEKALPPQLSLSQLRLKDENGNNAIEANEDCAISFMLTNTGKGDAEGMKAVISDIANKTGLTYDPQTALETIKPGDSRTYHIPLKAGMDLVSGTAQLKLSFYEPLGFQPDPVELKLTTVEFARPKIVAADYSFTSVSEKLVPGMPIKLSLLLQDKGAGDAEDVKVSFGYPAANIFPTGNESFSLGHMGSGESRRLEFEFMANKNYTSAEIPVTATVTEKYGKFGLSQVFNARLNSSSGMAVFDPKPGISGKSATLEIPDASLTSDVDKNIPENPAHPNRFALIIGNEDYQGHQSGLSSEQNVAFAQRDATVFKEYALKALGVPQQNCILITNADNVQMGQNLALIQKLAAKYGPEAELLIYYAGHGFPDEKTKEPYLIPVNVSGANLEYGIKLNNLYGQLSQLNVARVTVILDACFSGGGRGTSLLADRAIRINPASSGPAGKLVIFAATTADQVALPYRGQQHGMFTYFLLKKLQESKADINYTELGSYLSKEVALESLRVNKKDQEPGMLHGTEITGELNKWKMK